MKSTGLGFKGSMDELALLLALKGEEQREVVIIDVRDHWNTYPTYSIVMILASSLGLAAPAKSLSDF